MTREAYAYYLNEQNISRAKTLFETVLFLQHILLLAHASANTKSTLALPCDTVNYQTTFNNSKLIDIHLK